VELSIHAKVTTNKNQLISSHFRKYPILLIFTASHFLISF